jgi:hypothetical protein
LIVNGQTVDKRVVTVPLDGDDVVYDVDVSAIRDKALTGKGVMKENLKAYSADGSVFLNETPRTDSAFAGWTRRTAQDCFHARALPANGELPVTSKPGQYVPKLALKNVVPTYFDFATGERNVVVKFNGLTYVVYAHTTARFDCVTFFTSAGPLLVPTVYITSGTVGVLGQPTHQIATALVTREATFRTLNREKVNIIVERQAKLRRSTMSVVQGKTAQATHLIGSGANFACKSGKRLTVGPHGIIK